MKHEKPEPEKAPLDLFPEDLEAMIQDPTTDDEIDTIREVVRMLSDFDRKTRRRILAYLESREYSR